MEDILKASICFLPSPFPAPGRYCSCLLPEPRSPYLTHTISPFPPPPLIRLPWCFSALSVKTEVHNLVLRSARSGPDHPSSIILYHSSALPAFQSHHCLFQFCQLLVVKSVGPGISPLVPFLHYVTCVKVIFFIPSSHLKNGSQNIT